MQFFMKIDGMPSGPAEHEDLSSEAAPRIVISSRERWINERPRSGTLVTAVETSAALNVSFTNTPQNFRENS